MSFQEKLKQELKDIPSNFVVLILTDPEKFEGINTDILSILVDEMHLKGGYVNIENPISKAVKQMKEKNIDVNKVTFVSCVNDNGKIECKSIETSSDLISLNIALETILESKEDNFIIIDSLNKLISENDYISLIEFMQNFSMHTRIKGMGNVLLASDNLKQRQEIEDLSEFCDKVIDLT